MAWQVQARQVDGRQFVQIDRWYLSSKRCHGCGYVLASLPLNVRIWDCTSSTEGIDRDRNAARNILQAGTALLAGAER